MFEPGLARPKLTSGLISQLVQGDPPEKPAFPAYLGNSYPNILRFQYARGY